MKTNYSNITILLDKIRCNLGVGKKKDNNAFCQLFHEILARYVDHHRVLLILPVTYHQH